MYHFFFRIILLIWPWKRLKNRLKHERERESRGWVLQQVLVSSRAEYAFNMSASAFVNLGHLALRFSTQHNFILHFVLI